MTVVEGDVVLCLAGGLEDLKAYVTIADPAEGVVEVWASGMQREVLAFDEVERVEPLERRSYDDVLRDIEEVVLDGGREPTDEDLAVLEAQLHGRMSHTDFVRVTRRQHVEAVEHDHRGDRVGQADAEAALEQDPVGVVLAAAH